MCEVLYHWVSVVDSGLNPLLKDVLIVNNYNVIYHTAVVQFVTAITIRKLVSGEISMISVSKLCTFFYWLKYRNQIYLITN